MGTKLKTVSKDANPAQMKQNESYPLEKSDLTAAVDLAIRSLKVSGGRPFEYEPTPEGLRRFREKSIKYLEYVQTTNSNPDLEKGLLPDIEGWACFLQITRQTIYNYETSRGGEWESTIKMFKNAIASVKKQMGLTYRIPPVAFMFDLTNNHHYHSVSEFHLIPEQPQDKKTQEKLLLEQQIRDSGLVWDETAGEFLPAERGGKVIDR